MKRRILITLFLLIAGLSFATDVIFYEGNNKSLKAKWTWAQQSSPQNTEKIWIGYSIAKTKNDGRIGSWSSHNSYQTLYDILGTSKASHHARSKMALIFLLDRSQENSKITDVKIGSFDSEFNFKDLPLYWLDDVEQDDSVAWLRKQYSAVSADVKEAFVAAFGIHDTEASTKVLIKMVKTEPVNIQKDAVFWLGQQERDSAFDFLVKTLNSHPDIPVRKAAVFSISQIESDHAVDVIIETARRNSVERIRKEAIFWLGQMAAEQSSAVLKDIIVDEPTLELKKHAVFSLSQIDDEKSVDDLIQIAKTHPNAEVRKSAIFWLGESGSDKALDVLVGLLKD